MQEHIYLESRNWSETDQKNRNIGWVIKNMENKGPLNFTTVRLGILSD